jgi:tetratricopeptide (TPR) repeat protein
MNFIKRASTIGLFVLFFCAHTLRGQVFQLNANCLEIQQQLVQFNLSAASTLINKELKIHPENAALALLQNYVDFYTFIATQDVEWLKARQSKLNERIKALDACKTTDPYVRYAKSEIHLQWAFSLGIAGELSSAAFQFRNAYKQLEDNIKEYPSFAPNYKNMGMLQAMLGTTPDNYKWILKIVGMDGDFRKGINMLENFIEKEHKLPTEILDKQSGNYYYILLKLNFGNRKECWRYTDLYTRNNLNNPLYVYLRAFTAIKTAQSDEAIKTLSIRNSQTDMAFPLLDYLMGVAMLNAQNDDAAMYFKKFVSFSKGGNLIKDAYMRLAWHYLLRGNEKEAQVYKSMALQYGNSFSDEDKKAMKECSSKTWPNIELLTVRLLQDGGYYTKALTVLNQVKAQKLQPEQQAEYYYRLARILHEQQQYLRAIENYKTCITLSQNMSLHLAPYSNFYIGSIYEQNQNKEIALVYYKRVFEYKNFEYKTSIYQKARAGISRLES